MRLPLERIGRIGGAGGILAYHGIGPGPLSPGLHVSPATFVEQIEFINRRFTAVPLFEMCERLERGLGCRDLVSITFDDAYAGIIECAVPVLRAFGIPVTVFVATSASARQERFFWDTVARSVDGHGLDWEELLSAAALAPFPQSPASQAALRDWILVQRNGRSPWRDPASKTDLWRPLAFEELRRLEGLIDVTFGVHTVTHPNLTSLPVEEQMNEIRDCHAKLQSELNAVIPIVAYPFGLYDAGTVSSARQCGMRYGVTMQGHAPGRRPNPMIVSRVGVAQVHSLQSVERRLGSLFRPFLWLRNSGTYPRLPDAAASLAIQPPQAHRGTQESSR